MPELDIADWSLLDPAVRKLWRIEALIGGLVWLVLWTAAGVIVNEAIEGMPFHAGMLGAGVGLVFLALTFYVAGKKYDFWRFLVGADDLAVAHGIDTKTSVALLVQTVQLEDERLTYIEGTVRRSVGRALVEVAASRDDKGGTAARAQILTKVGAVNLSAEAIMAEDFRIEGRERQSLREARFSVDAPVSIGRATIPAHADVRYTERGDGSKYLEAAARLSSNINRFNLATDGLSLRNQLRQAR